MLKIKKMRREMVKYGTCIGDCIPDPICWDSCPEFQLEWIQEMLRELAMDGLVQTPRDEHSACIAACPPDPICFNSCPLFKLAVAFTELRQSCPGNCGTADPLCFKKCPRIRQFIEENIDTLCLDCPNADPICEAMCPTLQKALRMTR